MALDTITHQLDSIVTQLENVAARIGELPHGTGAEIDFDWNPPVPPLPPPPLSPAKCGPTPPGEARVRIDSAQAEAMARGLAQTAQLLSKITGKF
jgi:hypothetical protein